MQGASLLSEHAWHEIGRTLGITFVGSDSVAWQIDQVRINEGQVSAVLASTLAAFDADGDGLIDLDEGEVFHTDPLRADTDTDGMLDGAEVRAGTNPLSKDDVLTVVKADTISGFARVEWTAKANRTYQVMNSFDLQSWANALNGVNPDQQSLQTAVTNGLLNYVDPANATSGAGKKYYRVRLVE